MDRRRRADRAMRIPALLLAGLLSFAPAPVSAGTPEQPESADVAGDANAINNQGREELPDHSAESSPASIDGADLTAIWLETTYSTVKERDASGRVLAVRHIPQGLRINWRTVAPAKPTFGPGVIFRMAANVGEDGCQVQFELFVAGSAPGSSQRERADINRVRNCPGGDGVLLGFAHAFEENVASATFAFGLAREMLAEGVTVGPYTWPHTRVVHPGLVVYPTAPAIDQAPRISPFTIGSDVPPDVDCLLEPENAECT